MLSNGQARQFRQLLETRSVELRDEIHQELLDTDEQHFIDLAGQVRDLEEESVADLLVDLELASIDRHIKELRAIDAAVSRLNTGTFGVCADCSSEIDLDRLLVFPTAQRCHDCQALFERNHAGNERPTL